MFEGFTSAALRGAFASLFVALLAGCGGDAPRAQPVKVPAPRIDLAVPGQAVVKVRTGGGVVAVLEEHLVSIFELGPQRTLSIVAGGRIARTYMPPAGWTVADFAVHPSGEISAVLTTERDVRLARLDSAGTLLSDLGFTDAAAVSDPFFNYAGGVHDDSALQPVLMHDAARVVPLGESLALVLRTGRNAVVAYRFDPDGNRGYQFAWRTLVEPGCSIFGKGLISGSFDAFGQLDNHVRVSVDVDDSGTLAVGVVDAPMFNFTFRAHGDWFGEPIAASMGVLVTRLTGDGQRLGSTAVDTHQGAELHALRATSQGFLLAGRVISEVRPDGTGWNAFTALLGRDGTPLAYHVVDYDRGDVLFDVAELPNGRFLALGTTGYVQNPAGASISEDTQPLLALLDVDGAQLERIDFAGGARQNQLRSIARFGGGWLIGGMSNAPGTHSGDTQRDLITADGFLRQTIGLP